MTEIDQLKIRKLDGGLLLVFRELMARRQASAVARQLGLSPSAISHALARLREVYGDPLFVRRSHGLEPTARALELAPRIEALIASIGETVGGEPAFDPLTTRRRFRLGCGPAIDSLIAPGLVAVFREEAPLATFSMRPAFLEPALRAVRRRELDLAIGVFGHVSEELTAVVLFEDDYCVLARQGHPLVSGGRVDWQTYAAAGHVFVGNLDVAMTDQTPIDLESMNASYGAVPSPELIRTHAYVSLWETAMLVAATTDVLIDCPRSLAVRYAARLGLQVLVPPGRPFHFTVRAVRRADAPDPGLDWLLEKIAGAVRVEA